MTPAEVPLSSSSSLSPSPAAPGRWQMNILPTRELKHDKTKKRQENLGPRLDNVRNANCSMRHTWLDVQVYEARAVDVLQPHRHL